MIEKLKRWAALALAVPISLGTTCETCKTCDEARAEAEKQCEQRIDGNKVLANFSCYADEDGCVTKTMYMCTHIGEIGYPEEP